MFKEISVNNKEGSHLPTMAWSGLILVLVALAMGVVPWLTSRAEPTFTGDAPADFTDADTIFIPDPDGVGSVGLPPTAPAGTISGWDLAGVFFDYDHSTDTMYVGFDCVGICGDADGDGDPGGTGAWLAAQGGSDLANLSGDEAVVLLIDTNNDGSAEVAVGVNDASDISAFGAYNRAPTGFARPFDASRWGTQLPNPFSLYANPSAVAPDLEFSIGSFSTLPNFSFTPGEGFSFQMLAYAGSESDDGIREESFRATVNFLPLAAYGDLVWEDLDADGLQDTGEPGVGNVTASLYDCTGAFISTTLTTASGHYTFTMLEMGDYYAEFAIPEGYNSSPQDQGTDDTLDSDADPITGQTACTTLSTGESDPTWDAGIWRTASIGDYVWEDLDADGLQDGGEPAVTGVTTNLYDCTGALIDSTTSDTSGIYSFTNLIPGDYYAEFILPDGWAFTLRDQGDDDTVDSDANLITGRTACTNLDSGEYDPTWDAGMFRLLTLGDRVWYDTDQDGIQGATEPGVQNVTVDLYDDGTCAGTSIASDVTDASGAYGFIDLSPGTYCLQFSTVPAGWFITLQDQGGDDTVDSDADPGTGRVTGISLAANDPNADMGVYAVGSIGDTVFCDADGNGSFDAGEGVAGVTISLYEDPECDASPDALLTNQDTAGDGQYLFSGLPVGPRSGPAICYVVQVDAADMGTCDHPFTPASYAVPLDADNPDDSDSDFGFDQTETDLTVYLPLIFRP